MRGRRDISQVYEYLRWNNTSVGRTEDQTGRVYTTNHANPSQTHRFCYKIRRCPTSPTATACTTATAPFYIRRPRAKRPSLTCSKRTVRSAGPLEPFFQTKLIEVGAAHLENNVKGLESPVTAYLAELFHLSHWPNWATVSPAKTYLGKGLRAGRRHVAVPGPIGHPGSAALSAATSLAAVRSFRGLRDARDARTQSVIRGLKGRRDPTRSPKRPKRSYVAFSVEMRSVPASAGRMPTPIKRRERPTRSIQPSSNATGVAAEKTMDTGGQKTDIQLPARPLVVSRFRPIPPRPPRWRR